MAQNTGEKVKVFKKKLKKAVPDDGWEMELVLVGTVVAIMR